MSQLNYIKLNKYESRKKRKILGRMMTDEEEDEWTDDEDSVEKQVDKVNRISLSDLEDIIKSIVPSFQLTAKDWYLFLLWRVYVDSGTIINFHCLIIPQSLHQHCKNVLNSLKRT